MNARLDQLESKLQALFEERITAILPGLTLEDKVIQKLASAIKQDVIVQKDRSSIAPNVFTLITAPDSAAKWMEPRVLNAIKDVVATAVKQVGLQLESQPVVTITTDNTFSENEISVIASHKIDHVEETQGMSTNPENTQKKNDAIPENAFLIIEGVKIHPLTEPVVNIGRRLENHLVIDDPRISRNHAQLRAINGRYVLFDLNSTGGSFVNGQRTNQTVLYPGDVISLAGVALIFGQDNPPSRPEGGDTSPFKDVSIGERLTAPLEQKTVDIKTDRFKKNPESDK